MFIVAGSWIDSISFPFREYTLISTAIGFSKAADKLNIPDEGFGFMDILLNPAWVSSDTDEGCVITMLSLDVHP